MDALLARFAAGGDAVAVYESLRRRLILYFRLSEPVRADALADIVLDRLGKRVGEGVQVDNLSAYTLGIARLVLLEARAQAAREQRALRLEMAAPDSAASDTDGEPEEQRLLAALDDALMDLDISDRALILAYYGADGAAHIPARQALAERLGITPHALRNRALRLRARLENRLRAILPGASS